MMVDGNISGEGGIARCTPGGTAPPLRPSPHRPPGVTQKKGKIYTIKRCAALAMVTQPDKVLGWLCGDRKSTRLNSSHANISYAVFCLKKKQQHDVSYTLHFIA